jgi:single-strand DNA-binding protein
MINEPTIMISGNLTADPELRYTASGLPCATFTVAHNPRVKGADGEWHDGEPSFFRVTAWRDEAENIAESLRRGDPVIVTGRVRTNIWEDKHGQARRDLVVTADAVAVPLARHRVRLIKVSRAGRDMTAQESPESPGAEPGTDGQAEAPEPAAARSEPHEPESAGTARAKAARAAGRRGQATEPGAG